MMTEKKRVVIVGSGIGGLTAALKLAHSGNYDVQVYERLSFAGGRFTQHDHDGYAVPTGAVHMVPHGMKGPFAKMIFGKRSKGGLDLGRYGVEFLPSMCRRPDGNYALVSIQRHIESPSTIACSGEKTRRTG
jgi:phytoene dehydrogenase-like protein